MKRTNTFGTFFRQQRQSNGLTLRQFCNEYEFDPGNISRLERGLLTPPRDKEKLTRYARALGLKENSDAWHEFFDQAAIARGQIPTEIFNRKEMTARLSDILQVLQGRSISKEQQDALVNVIKGNGHSHESQVV